MVVIHYHQTSGTTDSSSVEELQTSFHQPEEHSQTKALEDLLSQGWQGQRGVNTGCPLFSKYYSRCHQCPVHQNRGAAARSWECSLIGAGKEKVLVFISFCPLGAEVSSLQSVFPAGCWSLVIPSLEWPSEEYDVHRDCMQCSVPCVLNQRTG